MAVLLTEERVGAVEEEDEAELTGEGVVVLVEVEVEAVVPRELVLVRGGVLDGRVEDVVGRWLVESMADEENDDELFEDKLVVVVRLELLPDDTDDDDDDDDGGTVCVWAPVSVATVVVVVVVVVVMVVVTAGGSSATAGAQPVPAASSPKTHWHVDEQTPSSAPLRPAPSSHCSPLPAATTPSPQPRGVTPRATMYGTPAKAAGVPEEPEAAAGAKEKERTPTAPGAAAASASTTSGAKPCAPPAGKCGMRAWALQDQLLRAASERAEADAASETPGSEKAAAAATTRASSKQLSRPCAVNAPNGVSASMGEAASSS